MDGNSRRVLTNLTKQKHDLLVFLTLIVKITFTGQSKLVIFFSKCLSHDKHFEKLISQVCALSNETLISVNQQ